MNIYDTFVVLFVINLITSSISFMSKAIPIDTRNPSPNTLIGINNAKDIVTSL